MGIEYSKDKTIGSYIGRMFRALRTTLHRNFEAEGYNMTLEQWLILVLLNKRDGQTQSELSVTSVKEKASITRLIDGLEKKNLIVRVQDKKDRRNNIVYLTKEGRNTYEALTPLAIKTNEKALKGLSGKEIELLTDLLDRMYNNLSMQ